MSKASGQDRGETPTERGMDRRSFLRSGLAGSAAIAAGGLFTACGGSGSKSTTSAARIVVAWACENVRQVCRDRLGAGSMPPSLRIFQTVDGASL